MNRGETDKNSNNDPYHPLAAPGVADEKVVASNYERHHRGEGKWLLKLRLYPHQDRLSRFLRARVSLVLLGWVFTVGSFQYYFPLTYVKT